MASRRLPQTDDRAIGYERVRRLSVALAAPLSDADATVQPHADASPAKWHLAHISWFFETFVLRDHVPGYRLHDAAWPFLFNSYYDGEGARHARHRRGMISRPSLGEILAYRAHVDAAMIAAIPSLAGEAETLVTLGLAHEQQHQELLVTDILATLAENPLCPAYHAAPSSARREAPPLAWIERPAGVVEIGAPANGFAFDAERPRHRALLAPHALGSRPATNGEWLGFIADGGYADPRLWLSDGWAWVAREEVAAPLYWRRDGNRWRRFGLDGLGDIDEAAPVAHVSFYEADAYARWSGARLPTEFEWEAAAASLDPDGGNQQDGAGPVAPCAADPGAGLQQMFGDVWEWTGSAFLPYPGFAPAEGTVGEYNGKFMSGQMVLRGGSCATPRGHMRASYRNFFPPHARWQFTGVRLARDV
jgi:ergothioneine biosynthesis protein EgtB